MYSMKYARVLLNLSEYIKEEPEILHHIDAMGIGQFLEDCKEFDTIQIACIEKHKFSNEEILNYNLANHCKLNKDQIKKEYRKLCLILPDANYDPIEFKKLKAVFEQIYFDFPDIFYILKEEGSLYVHNMLMNKYCNNNANI